MAKRWFVMRALYLHDRRILTVGIFAIASLLEICGCNPLRRGRQAGTNAPFARIAVQDHCADCASKRAAEPQTQHGAKEEQIALQPPALLYDKPSLATLLGQEAPVFYDPEAELPAEESRNMPSAQSVFALEDESVPWSIPESVFFVYKTFITADGKAHRIPSATAFVVSVPDLTHRTSARFLVTARHVVDPQWAHCAETNPPTIDIRLNRRNGGVGYETISLLNNSRPAYVISQDATADLALIPLDQRVVPSLDSYKFFDTPFRLLPTDSELRTIHPDQQIMTAGLLNRPSSGLGIYPVSHGGVLSSNTPETVTMQCGNSPGLTKLHVWFISASIPQGVSGAPVFASINRETGTSKTPVLLGVQAVAWPDRGVAGMTPSTVLRDLIQQALLTTKRRMDFSAGTKTRDTALRSTPLSTKPGA